jgi:hypothetical protein
MGYTFPSYEEFMEKENHTATEKLLLAAVATLSVTSRPRLTPQEAYTYLVKRAEKQYNRPGLLHVMGRG